MENRKCVILSIGVTLAICGMLCSSFWGRYSMFDNYFLLFPVSLGICLVTITAILSFLTKKKIFQLSVADVLISILVVYYIVRYDYELQLANWKIMYAILLLILWYALRILLMNATISLPILFGGIVGCLYGDYCSFMDCNHLITDYLPSLDLFIILDLIPVI